MGESMDGMAWMDGWNDMDECKLVWKYMDEYIDGTTCIDGRME